MHIHVYIYIYIHTYIYIYIHTRPGSRPALHHQLELLPLQDAPGSRGDHQGLLLLLISMIMITTTNNNNYYNHPFKSHPEAVEIVKDPC